MATLGEASAGSRFVAGSWQASAQDRLLTVSVQLQDTGRHLDGQRLLLKGWLEEDGDVRWGVPAMWTRAGISNRRRRVSTSRAVRRSRRLSGRTKILPGVVVRRRTVSHFCLRALNQVAALGLLAALLTAFLGR